MLRLIEHMLKLNIALFHFFVLLSFSLRSIKLCHTHLMQVWLYLALMGLNLDRGVLGGEVP